MDRERTDEILHRLIGSLVLAFHELEQVMGIRVNDGDTDVGVGVMLQTGGETDDRVSWTEQTRPADGYDQSHDSSLQD